MAELVEHRANGFVVRKAQPTSRVRKAVLIAATAALIVFSIGIVWSSGLIDSVVRPCAVEAGNGQCVDDIARHIPR